MKTLIHCRRSIRPRRFELVGVPRGGRAAAADRMNAAIMQCSEEESRFNSSDERLMPSEGGRIAQPLERYILQFICLKAKDADSNLVSQHNVQIQ